MSRIFDALKKAEAQRPAAPPPVAALSPSPPVPPRAPRATPPAPQPMRGGSALPAPRASAPEAVRCEVAAVLSEEVGRGMATLRAALESSLDDRGTRVVAFTSAQGGEGVSTVAAQFVVALSVDAQQRVLFVDANAQRPALLDVGGPLAALFVRGPRDGAASVDVIEVPAHAREARLYPVPEARALVETLGPSYDWIVMDVPPVLMASDAATLAAVADAVVMVVEAGRTKKPVLTRAVELLRKSGARVLGSVLNRRRLEIPEFIYRRL